MKHSGLVCANACRWVVDVRFWIWPVTLAVAWWLDRDWAPAFGLWRDPAGGVLVTGSARSLLWPGALTLAALVGTVRAWSGRSVLNGAYLAACLPVFLVFGAVGLARLSHRLQIDQDRLTVRTHGVYWHTVSRRDLVRLEELAVSRRGVIRAFPVLVRADGSRVHVRSEAGWPFAEEVARLWGVPVVAAKGAIQP